MKSRQINRSCPMHFKKLYQDKYELNVYFDIYSASKGFMNAIKDFIKPPQAWQRSVKMKI